MAWEHYIEAEDVKSRSDLSDNMVWVWPWETEVIRVWMKGSMIMPVNELEAKVIHMDLIVSQDDKPWGGEKDWAEWCSKWESGLEVSRWQLRGGEEAGTSLTGAGILLKSRG